MFNGIEPHVKEDITHLFLYMYILGTNDHSLFNLTEIIFILILASSNIHSFLLFVRM